MRIEQLIELNYSANLHQHYQNLCDLPGFVLLESGDRHWGRYDIIAAYPYERKILPSNANNQLALLSDLRELLKGNTSSYELPFQGGAIGYITYDLGAELMGLASKTQTLLDTMPLLHLGFYDWCIIVDHYLKKTVLYAAHHHSQTKEQIKEVLGLWNKTGTTKQFRLMNEFTPLMTKEQYKTSFAEIKKALREGRSYQVNFTQAFQAQYEGSSWAMYHNISKANPVPFAAFLHFDNEDVLSFSPERFLLHEEGKLLTSPIKGTIKRSNNLEEDERLKVELASSAKNRAENVMIVDLLRNDLGKIAVTGSVEVSKLCEIQSYNSVHHLVSDVEAQCLANTSVLDLFLSCFPGGSITGAPKLESMRIINELEPHRRGVYCGSVVYFSRHGRFDSNIAIRTLVAKNNILHLAAGGGNVIDSDCEDEYRECYLKIKAIINGLK
ncbi:aminodeoxychorismate synthase component I [Legionella sp. km772]|uniref:aminodeoxychorismate synthase component I n=1 Tax=Legionella sp. km772 TaxID=2498111 RepID=UPI000F8D0992|nr:aminodeoxychorismate synthase component I [Legionella sp. km772]RUR12807.1 aminodeoxychorismate synthase component I [Legionella sp. km772]